MIEHSSPLRLGTRGSPLALYQARAVAAALCAAHGWPGTMVEIVEIRTTGDIVRNRALAEIGGKALWTMELDHALLSGEIDLAVHSMKDVEAIRPPEIGIAAMLPREDIRECLIGASSLVGLPLGARVGTSSPRRAAQLLRARPDLTIMPVRGNVATRLAKVEANEIDATLLAAAGLIRLGYEDLGAIIPLDAMLPALQQGAIGVESCTARTDLWPLLARIDHKETHRCVSLERLFLRRLGGGCHSPVAGYATIHEGSARLDVEIFSADGREWRRGTATVAAGDEASGIITSLVDTMLADASVSIRHLFNGPVEGPAT
ncbi:hydroxymethylbilane synthase [Sphingobium sp. LB126]|uniref:hydroxymethylbilane synthase n=1 Tax=Sphingobium sp. LB126 TaxID=1983755 RepID=UPI000CB50319|nr:hydroxymethylbilane synthase [Sphingobium sp. LB126]PJG47152.1 hydroxymethylbilane synthase [Sphingobium sp. LB126]